MVVGPRPFRIGFAQMDILDTLESCGPLSAGQVSAETGIPVAYGRMLRLRDRGLVEVVDLDSRPWVYRMTDRGAEALRRARVVGRSPGVSTLREERPRISRGQVALLILLSKSAGYQNTATLAAGVARSVSNTARSLMKLKARKMVVHARRKGTGGRGRPYRWKITDDGRNLIGDLKELP